MTYQNRTELVEQICEQLAKGTPMAEICRQDGMPSVSVVHLWAEADLDISASIARARVTGFDAIAEKCLDIADAAPERDAMGKIDPGDVQNRKLRTETRLKLLAKWDPKRYGDQLNVTADIGLRALPIDQVREEAIKLALKLGVTLPTSVTQSE